MRNADGQLPIPLHSDQTFRKFGMRLNKLDFLFCFFGPSQRILLHNGIEIPQPLWRVVEAGYGLLQLLHWEVRQDLLKIPKRLTAVV